MKKKNLVFYATRNDLSNIMKEIETENKLLFIEAGLFDMNRIPEECNSYGNIEFFGIALMGEQTAERSYLVIDYHYRNELIIRDVKQNNGEMKHAIDQLNNPMSIVLSPGGEFQNGQIIIAGQVGTISEDDRSLYLFSIFSKKIRKNFSKIKSYFVGREALSKLNLGVRLTTGISSPKEYDLSMN